MTFHKRSILCRPSRRHFAALRGLDHLAVRGVVNGALAV
jgi:hypothetical protein